jgi:hypothetical protein
MTSSSGILLFGSVKMRIIFPFERRHHLSSWFGKLDVRLYHDRIIIRDWKPSDFFFLVENPFSTEKKHYLSSPGTKLGF